MTATAPAPLLDVTNLTVALAEPRRWPWQPARRVTLLHDISFALAPGETAGLVGGSGAGKSTLARALVGLVPITSGRVRLAGHDATRLDARGWRPLRRTVQMVFQDPLGSLDPRLTVGAAVAEPLRALRPDLGPAERKARVAAMLARVGLPARLGDAYPHQLSGGQAQRAGLARALVVEPRLLICDEAVSALDVSVQAQVVNLLAELCTERSLSLLFVAHDLSVVRHLCPRVLVLGDGRLVEDAPRERLFTHPVHPVTRALLAAVPGQRRYRHQPQPPEGDAAADPV